MTLSETKNDTLGDQKCQKVTLLDTKNELPPHPTHTRTKKLRSGTTEAQLCMAFALAKLELDLELELDFESEFKLESELGVEPEIELNLEL